MPERTLALDPEPSAALAAILGRSSREPVVVLKKSPTCHISHRAEREFRSWVAALPEGTPLAVAEIDVIAERALARGLTTALDVRHESPQALWFEGGELRWHGSHGELTKARFAELAGGEAR